MVTYGNIFLCLCLFLIVRHIFNPITSRQSKILVLSLSSITLLFKLMGFAIFGMIVVFALALYCITYRIINSPEKPSSGVWPFEKTD